MKHLSDNNFNNNQLDNVPLPVDPGDAVNKEYADRALSYAPNPYVEGVPLYSVGHSYTMYPYPYGTRYTGEYYMRIKDRLHLGSVTAIGRSGTYAADNLGRMISPIYDLGRGQWVPNSKGICLIQNTINELGQDAASETKFRNLWAQSIRGEIAVMSSRAIKGYADQANISGTWTKGGGGGNRNDKGINGEIYLATSSSGAWVEWTVSGGDEVWVVGVASTAAYPVGGYRVICNGSTLATVTANGLKPDYNDKVLGVNLEYTPWFFRITGLNAAAGTTGAKTVRVQANGSSNNSFLSGIVEPSPNPPMVFLAKEPPRINSGEANYNANIGWFNAMTDTIASEFDNVVTVDLANGWDNDTMIGSLDPANFHPNDIGQSKTADNFVQAINQNITTWIDGVAIL